MITIWEFLWVSLLLIASVIRIQLILIALDDRRLFNYTDLQNKQRIHYSNGVINSSCLLLVINAIWLFNALLGWFQSTGEPIYINELAINPILRHVTMMFGSLMILLHAIYGYWHRIQSLNIMRDATNDHRV